MNKKMEHIEKLVPDTSVIIEGLVSLKIEKKEIRVAELILHEAVFAELEHQANEGKAIGHIGLDEIKKLKEISQEFNFNIRFAGKRPTAGEIRYAKIGEIDALIRQLAWEEDATLITADKVQAKVAEARGIKLILIHKEEAAVRKLKLERFFDEQTMSVHLRENVEPHAKKGKPGAWEFATIEAKPILQAEIKEISAEIIEEARARSDAFVEIEREGSTIVQLGKFRIVITRPPFSDGWEITAVRPVKKLNMDDYKLKEKLSKRISEQAEGILIAGAPGHGKSTFAQALAEYYAKKNKIVKTVEAPRDLILPDEITQYSIARGSSQEIHDILLLSRPDYTIFDEMRNTADFMLFTDLRLAGIGLAGVVHATNPIDAIQRFVGRIELGVIPQVIDTVIFIRNGEVAKTLSLQMIVKVPSGMTEADLARPVVTVSDFETGKLEYELYSYGEETVVVPVRGTEKVSGAKKLASRAIEQEFRRYTDSVQVDVVSDNKCIVYVPSQDIARVIGKGGQTIDEIEKKLGISIDVQELGSKKPSNESGTGKEIKFSSEITKKSVQFYIDDKYSNKNVDIFVDNDYLLTANVGKKGILKIRKDNKIGSILMKAINTGEEIKVVVKE